MVLDTSESPPPVESNLLPPIESISSINIIVGAFFLAISNNSLTNLAPSPIYFYTSSPPDTLMKVQPEWWATAQAIRVFPVPGGPYRRTPLGYGIPVASYNSGCFIGNSITSLISSIYLLSPPIIS